MVVVKDVQGVQDNILLRIILIKKKVRKNIFFSKNIKYIENTLNTLNIEHIYNPKTLVNKGFFTCSRFEALKNYLEQKP